MENFIVYRNRIAKEISSISKEDFKKYAKHEWDNFVLTYRLVVTEQDTIEIRDMLGISIDDVPITLEEKKIVKEKKALEMFTQQLEKEKAAKELWDSLTPEERKQKLRQSYRTTAFGVVAIIGIVIAIFISIKPDYIHPYPASGCPINHFWDKKEGLCKKYYNLP